MSGAGQPQILAVVRASPLRERTAGLLESLVSQEPAGMVRVIVLTRRRGLSGPEFGTAGVEEVPADPDFLGQVRHLALTSGCRWLVLPSSVDRYLPGALDAVARSGVSAGGTVVGPCQVVQRGEPVVIGPQPFRFDYFALLAGFNYVAPGATFIDIGEYLREGGFDPRYSSAANYEYLLRVGAAHGLESCPDLLLETEANPFPGIAPEWVASYAAEALAIILTYNRSFIAPGSALGMGAVLADQLAPFRHAGFYDKRLASLLTAGAGGFRQRYLDQLGITEPPVVVRPLAPPPPAATALGLPAMGSAPVSLRLRVRLKVKALAPRPLWDLLRRARRGWEAFRDPLP